MLIDFCKVADHWQLGLLALSLLTVVALTGCGVLLLRYRSKRWKLWSMGALLVANVVLYTLMQLDGFLARGDAEGNLSVPYLALLLVTLVSLTLVLLVILSETGTRKTINRASIKEAFDHLPTGVCFFNDRGIPVLCNLAMKRFSFAVSGRDVQFITDLEDLLSPDFIPQGAVEREENAFILPGDLVMQLEKRELTDDNGDTYTQFVAADVTQLYGIRRELTAENEQLRKTQLDLKRLSANMVAMTREEEILNTKMRIHDDMGRCLMTARQYLQAGDVENIPADLVDSWQHAISMIKYNNDSDEEEMLTQIRETCRYANVDLRITGQLPRQEKAAYLLTCALRECVTNAVRYAAATELYADFTEAEGLAAVTVTNNGDVPKRQIKEGGGLSTLRRRVERAGGTMTVQSFPRFALCVKVPKGKEEIL